MTTYVYKITRTDGLEYIGITVDVRSRKKAHEKSRRFATGIKEFEILEKCENWHHAEIREEYYIRLFDTWTNGLNVTSDGKGLNGKCEFNTFGYKFTDESRHKMSIAKKDFIPWNVGKKYKISKLSAMKGRWTYRKLDPYIVEQLLLAYAKHPYIDIPPKSKNGRIMSYEHAFAKRYAQEYGLSVPGLRNIITGKTLAWKDLYEKTLG